MITSDRYEAFFKNLWYYDIREDITLKDKAKIAQSIGMRKSEFLDFIIKVPAEGWADEVAVNSKDRYEMFFKNLWISGLEDDGVSFESKKYTARKIGMTEAEFLEFIKEVEA